MFKNRSYTPIPFLICAVVFASPSVISLAVGFCIAFVGELVRFWGVSIVGAETRTTGTVGGTFLITNGPFAYVRNPLYLGNMLLYAGVGVMSMALFPWLLLAGSVWFYLQYSLIVKGEEEYLSRQFGEPYAHYVRHVGRFLPRLTPYRGLAQPVKTVNPAEGLASERRTLQAIVLVTIVIAGIYVVRNW